MSSIFYTKTNYPKKMLVEFFKGKKDGEAFTYDELSKIAEIDLTKEKNKAVLRSARIALEKSEKIWVQPVKIKIDGKLKTTGVQVINNEEAKKIVVNKDLQYMNLKKRNAERIYNIKWADLTEEQKTDLLTLQATDVFQRRIYEKKDVIKKEILNMNNMNYIPDVSYYLEMENKVLK